MAAQLGCALAHSRSFAFLFTVKLPNCNRAWHTFRHAQALNQETIIRGHW